MIPILLLDEFMENYWTTPTYYSHLIQYLGYALSGFMGIFLTSYVYKKTGMIESY